MSTEWDRLAGSLGRALASPRLGLALMAAGLAAGLALFQALPERVPVHWDLSGRPNGWLAPWPAVTLLPAITLALWGLLLGIARLDLMLRRPGPEARAYRVLANAIVAYLVLVHLLVVTGGAGLPLDPGRGTLVGLGGLFLALAWLVPHLPRGGLNLPGARPSAAWTAGFGRFVRRVFAAGGAIIAAIGTLARGGVAAATVIALVVVVCLAPLGYLAARPPRPETKRSDPA